MYGIKLILETDAGVLIAQFNRSGTELLWELVIQWIAWIQLFDFEIWHIPGQKQSTADGLSQHPLTAADWAEAEVQEDIDKFLLPELNNFRVSLITLYESILILDHNFLDKSWRIATYLTTLLQPPEINIREFYAFKKKAVKFQI